MKTRLIKIVIVSILALVSVSTWLYTRTSAAQGGGPFSSQPLALSWDDSQLAVCNPDANTVSIFQVQADKNSKVSEIPTGKEPSGVAFSPDGTRLYVANRVDGTVSVISQGSSQGYGTWTTTTIPVGTEPYGMVLSASGNKLYVTNTASSSVSVINISTNQVTKTISNVGPLPRGIAITHGANITADNQQLVYVTNFLALPTGSGQLDGFDDAKTGFVTAISVGTDTVIETIKLATVADTGFKAAGNALQHIAAPAAPVATDFTFTTGAYPNQLNTIATRGNFAYIPSTAASPNGPVRFNVNTQSLVNVINLNTNKDAGQTINLQSAVGAQANANKLFITQPWAIAFKNNADQAYVVSAASNIVVKLTVNATSGAPTVQTNLSDPSSVLEIPVGRNPRGIVINSGDTRAYVMNYISRDVSIIDLTQAPEKVLATVSSTAVPPAGTLQDKIQIGKELFNTSVGIFDPPAAGQPAITGRMSNNGWGSCASCHPDGLTDNVVWIFATGPRRTVPLHATFAPGNGTQQRALNWSAIFDEVEDFEGNIRNVSGGLGIMVQTDGITQATALGAFTPAAAGQKQLLVRGVGGWDAIKAYVQFSVRAPLSPVSKQDPDVATGQLLFIQSNCQSCHGTSLWTTSRVTFTPPPDTSLIQNAQLVGQLNKVGTFDAATPNEVRATAAAPLGADGFNPPPLLSLYAFPQTFFHNGSADTLEAVMANVAHRTAGTGGNDFLTFPGARAQLIKFLLSIDGNTVVIDPKATLPPPTITKVANAFGNAPLIAPNTWVYILGTNLAPDARIWQNPDFGGNQLPAQLDGVSATVNGKSAFVYYISPTQVNILTPPDPLSGSVPVQLSIGGVKSNVISVQAQAQSLSFFEFVSSVNGLPYIYGRHGSDNSLIGPANLYPGLTTPAKPGESIYVAGTGFGATTVPVISGSLTQSGTLPTPWPVVTVGGFATTVTFAGLVADGTYQFNFTVPASAPDGDLPLKATYNGLTTQPGLLITVQH